MPTYIWNVMITYDVIFGSSVKDSSRRTVEERLRLAVAGRFGVSRHHAKMLSHLGNGRDVEWLKRWRLQTGPGSLNPSELRCQLSH